MVRIEYIDRDGQPIAETVVSSKGIEWLDMFLATPDLQAAMAKRRAYWVGPSTLRIESGR
jgi:hypothetical protein